MNPSRVFAVRDQFRGDQLVKNKANADVIRSLWPRVEKAATVAGLASLALEAHPQGLQVAASSTLSLDWGWIAADQGAGPTMSWVDWDPDVDLNQNCTNIGLSRGWLGFRGI